MIKGNHVSKGKIDTNNKVFVKRWFWMALFCKCEAGLLCLWTFLQMAMLQPQRINSSVKAYEIQKWIETLWEIMKYERLTSAEIRAANVQTMKIARWYKVALSMFGVSAANKQRTASQMISRLQILGRPEKKWLQQQRRICPKIDLRLLPITYTDFPRKGKCNPVATEFLSSSQHTPYCRLETCSSYAAF